jgi:hypothetical protein
LLDLGFLPLQFPTASPRETERDLLTRPQGCRPPNAIAAQPSATVAEGSPGAILIGKSSPGAPPKKGKPGIDAIID